MVVIENLPYHISKDGKLYSRVSLQDGNIELIGYKNGSDVIYLIQTSSDDLLARELLEEMMSKDSSRAYNEEFSPYIF